MRFRTAVLFALLLCLSTTSFAGDPLKNDRGQMKVILKDVSANINANFYDPKLKGVDWQAATEEARLKIENATSVNEMVSAIYYLTQMVHDSHTYFIPPRSTVFPKYGFELKAFGDDIRVYDLEKNGAAEKAGLKLGDQVASINNDLATRASLQDLLVKHWILNPLNPMMVMVKDGPGQYRQVDVVPKIETRPAVLDRWNRFGDLWRSVTDGQSIKQKYFTHKAEMRGDIGYLLLTIFDEDLYKITALVESLSTAKAIVLDMRDNPGGRVSTELTLLGMFETSPTELGTRFYRGGSRRVVIQPQKPRITAPVVVLVDSNSASAAEITAKFLQMRHGAIVVGDRSAGLVNTSATFSGKVGNQVVVDYENSVTVERLEVLGESLEGNPVKPAIKCIPTQDDMRKKLDPCLDLAFKAAQNAISTAKTETASK